MFSKPYHSIVSSNDFLLSFFDYLQNRRVLLVNSNKIAAHNRLQDEKWCWLPVWNNPLFAV